MVEDDDVQLVESMGGIDGTPLASDVQSLHMHGSISVSSIATTSNHVAIIVVSNFATIVLDSVEVQI
jgi:hypothetical protein